MGMNHLEVAMQRHYRHERDAGRAVDSQHEMVDAAPGRPKHPDLLPSVRVDTEGHADDEQEVSQDQVEEEQSVGFPPLHAETEDPQGNYVWREAHDHLNAHDNSQEQVPIFVSFHRGGRTVKFIAIWRDSQIHFEGSRLFACCH